MTVVASGRQALPTPPQADPKRPVTPPPDYQDTQKAAEDAFAPDPEHVIPGAYHWVQPPTALAPHKAAAPAAPPKPVAIVLQEALRAADAALDADIKSTETQLKDMRAKLPWFARRLGRGVGRVVLPVAMAASVVFAVMALPLLALLAGVISGLMTWLWLREQDPDQAQVTEVLENKPRPAPEVLVKRPRLQVEKLTIKLAALKRCRADVMTLRRNMEMQHNQPALKAVQEMHRKLTQDLQGLDLRIKPLNEAVGSGTWVQTAKKTGGAVALAFVLSHAYGFAQLPLGSFWSTANSVWLKPLVMLSAALYGKEATAGVLASLDHKNRILADALEILQAQREGLMRGKALYVDMIWQAQGKPSLWQRMKKAFSG